MSSITTSIGASLDRIEARSKVTGEAKYAYEFGADGVAYAVIVQSRVAKGKITAIAAPALEGIVAVITHENAAKLEPVPDGELAVLQSSEIAYRGQPVAVVVAESFELAQARPLRDNGFKVPLARNLIAHTLTELAA